VKTLLALALLAALAVAVLAIVGLLLRAAVRRWGEVHARWELDEHSDGEAVKVLVTKVGEEALQVGYVPFGASDFDSRLYEARAEARARVYALNGRDS
jgi:hypothetical protein